ncbi:MAG: phosphatidylserine decarboxylase family protein [Bacteroidales bacterium]|jgi:phosphatidylserine decarboxylase|nr:phosphatidylserine decarboxylase family protein [Bacteroidales bacterium]
MKIHREGYKIIFYSIVILATLNIIIIYLFSDYSALWIPFLSLSVLTLLLVLAFFRRPLRKVEEDAGKILCAADGRVVAIEEMEENEYFGDRRLQVSVFMTVFNVHFNTYPVSGTVKYVRHHTGKFYPANHPKSSVLNERLTVVIETESGEEIMIRQVAGLIARRIVSYAKPGLKVKQGDELGFIKFGSRVDIFLPPGTRVNVNLLQAVHANRDILAEI